MLTNYLIESTVCPTQGDPSRTGDRPFSGRTWILGSAPCACRLRTEASNSARTARHPSANPFSNAEMPSPITKATGMKKLPVLASSNCCASNMSPPQLARRLAAAATMPGRFLQLSVNTNRDILFPSGVVVERKRRILSAIGSRAGSRRTQLASVGIQSVELAL